MDFEHIVYDGAGGGEVTDTVTIPWTSAATATQSQPSPLPALHAFMTGTARPRRSPPLASGRHREADDTYTHDSYGRVTSPSSVPGHRATPSEDTCTTTSYAANTSDAGCSTCRSEVIVTSVPVRRHGHACRPTRSPTPVPTTTGRPRCGADTRRRAT